MTTKNVLQKSINIAKNILKRWRNRGLFVIADARDNSITISKRLYHLIDRQGIGDAKVYVFRLGTPIDGSVCRGSTATDGDYAFMLNPPISQSTQLADLQFNSRHRCIGFESLVPTVNRIFYDYGLSPHKPVRLLPS